MKKSASIIKCGSWIYLNTISDPCLLKCGVHFYASLSEGFFIIAPKNVCGGCIFAEKQLRPIKTMRKTLESATKTLIRNARGTKDTSKESASMRNPQKKSWDKPVSQSFYSKLEIRVGEIITSLGYVKGWRDEFMKYIERYLLTGECPQRRYCEEFVVVIFYSLKGEIDAAVERSAACRRRAAERRARKEDKTVDSVVDQNNKESSKGDKGRDILLADLQQEDMGSITSSRIETWHRRYGNRARG